jgi:uncharacterized repeat protein (TIGR04076 family)
MGLAKRPKYERRSAMIQNEGLKGLVTGVFGMPEEDVAKVTPELEGELLNAMSKAQKYRLIAEVVSSKYCFAGLQPGQRYVVERGQQLNPTESTAPMCLGAIGPLAEKAVVLLDRMTHNGDVMAHIRGYRCTDPGLNVEGLGCVEFKVRVEEVG